MNPILVIAGFIVALAVLIYYLQSRGTKSEKGAPSEKSEVYIIKIKDYEAQYLTEKQKEKPVEEPVKQEPTTEPQIDKPEKDDIELLGGVGPKYQELLRTAGYTTQKAIAESDPMTLYEILLKVNEEKGITKRPPTLRNIEDWIKSASH